MIFFLSNCVNKFKVMYCGSPNVEKCALKVTSFLFLGSPVLNLGSPGDDEILIQNKQYLTDREAD